MSVAEEALRSAVEAGKTVTDKTSNAFRLAEERLLEYRATVHPR
jgi:transcriptional regulator GlxA family with amidase domain